MCEKHEKYLKDTEKTVDKKDRMLYNIIINKVKEIREVNLCQSPS